ncbi:MAG: Molybdopterin oxidoreductase, iron-sulfur binding subunit, partial [Myxococcaceae bacterium]|nr:Molybdopterin oxidoreductase, iron-sulfur binding subunit [Myxococcaceae bacterium]
MKKDPYAPLREQMSQPPTHWRSLEHKEKDLSEVSPDEFENGTIASDGFNRRDVLKIAGASIALSGMACIRRPEDEILPYTRMPESVIPGVRMNYATVINRSEGAIGVVVEANEGRPTKIEGNPLHPSSLGASDIWAQAEVLGLYDPDRARVPHSGGKPSTWEAFDAFATEHFGKLTAAAGKGLAILLEEDGGPTFERLLKAAQAKLPEAKVYRYDPLAADGAQAGAQLAFGPGARVHPELENAKVLFALDSDFLIKGPEHLRLARQFGKSRAVLTRQDAAAMNRLYVAEGVFSSTGANADHRVRVPSGQCGELLKALARELGAKHGLALGELAAAVEGAAVPAGAEKFVTALAKDLATHKQASAILVGERQPPAVHALAYALNALLDPAAATRSTTGQARTSHLDSITALTKALGAGEVQTLLIFGANPVYTAPGALKFGEALAKAPVVIHAGVLPDETAQKATWHVPLTHFLESWGDATAWNGLVSIAQPLILPLFGSRASTSLLAQLTGHPERSDRKLVEETWRAAGSELAGVKAWRRALHDGVAGGVRALAPMPPLLPAVAAAVAQLKPTVPSKGALELVAVHGHVLDGRLSNLTWTQELPDSMSKLCWDNAVLVSPALAKEAGILSKVDRNGYKADVVELAVDGRKIKAPAFVLPGLAAYTVAILHGYGKTTGAVATGLGVDVGPLLTDNTGVVQGVTLTRTSDTQILCSTQDHFSVPANPFKELTFAQMVDAKGVERTLGLGERPLLRTGTTDEWSKGGEFAKKGSIPDNLLQPGAATSRPSRPIQLHDEVTYEGQQWGMTIDLASCIGCNACAIACVAENNIPSVGREQVLLGRELHWIRIDRYFQGDIDDPKAAHQPLPCMHCENAPCEPVCPVAATVHDEEGVNSMSYNRCIGTRYCANNCPFKVRRFNYLDFSATGNLVPGTTGNLSGMLTGDKAKVERMKTLKLQRNPDVTVRYRGVMEKCTFCTQRVEEAKIAAKRAGRDRKALPDGAVTPACAQACPTQAITFGNINDPASRVAKAKLSERNYEMLQELNIRPRTTFLARVK